MCRQTDNLWFILIEKGREKKVVSDVLMPKWIFLQPYFFFFFKKVWLFQIKVVPLHQQFPPRLLTMRTTAGLRHLKGYEI